MFTKAILIILFTLAPVMPAFAYIDPGSGSAIASIIIGLFVAIGVVAKSFFYKIQTFFYSLKKLAASLKNTKKFPNDER